MDTCKPALKKGDRVMCVDNTSMSSVITVARDYIVYAVDAFHGALHLQVVDDTETLRWFMAHRFVKFAPATPVRAHCDILISPPVVDGCNTGRLPPRDPPCQPLPQRPLEEVLRHAQAALKVAQGSLKELSERMNAERNCV